MVSMVFIDFVFVVDADDGTCKGSYFTEGDEDGLVNDALRGDEHAHKEEDESSEGERRSSYQL